jgi:hypothetical protein
MHVPCTSSNKPDTARFASVQKPESAFSVHGMVMFADVHTTDKVDAMPTHGKV